MSKKQTAESFWARVDKSGGDDECWEWQISLITRGETYK